MLAACYEERRCREALMWEASLPGSFERFCFCTCQLKLKGGLLVLICFYIEHRKLSPFWHIMELFSSSPCSIVNHIMVALSCDSSYCMTLNYGASKLPACACFVLEPTSSQQNVFYLFLSISVLNTIFCNKLT